MEILSPFQILCLTIFTTVYLYIYFYRSKSKHHGFKCYPIFGTLPEFIFNRHHFLDWATSVLADCPTNTAVFYRIGKLNSVYTSNPETVEHVLKSNFKNYPKGPRFRTHLQDFLGDGIFNTDGELWKIQRKTASYEFNTKSLRNFVMENVLFELETRLVPVLENASRTERVLDFQDVLERFAFDNICKVSFNVDVGCLGGDFSVGVEFMQAFEDAATLSSGRFMYLFPRMYAIKKYFNLGSEKKLRKAIAIVHDFADKIIKTRIDEKTEKKDEDLLSRFVGNTENNSVEFLRDIVISFILAGRDTTSAALTWFFWLLSSNPKVEERILQELENIRKQNGKSVGEIYSYDELHKMHYLHASISEAMRLYPPVPIDTKTCLEADILPDGTFIGKNWLMTYHTYAMGRMKNIWGEDCCEYRPERWIDENGIYKQESPFKFLVFHAGPRICLGKDMAYIQMKSVVASVLERFVIEVDLEKGKCPEHLLSLTLRMKGGLPVRVKERRLT